MPFKKKSRQTVFFSQNNLDAEWVAREVDLVVPKGTRKSLIEIETATASENDPETASGPDRHDVIG